MSKTGDLFGSLPMANMPIDHTKAIRCRHCQHMLREPADRAAGAHKDCEEKAP